MAACKGTSVLFPAAAQPLPRYIANKTITAQVRERQAAERAEHDRGKSHMSYFREITNRQRQWGAPGCATAPYVEHPAGLGYSIHRQFATSTCRLNAFAYGSGTNAGACRHNGCSGARETPEHVVRHCLAAPIVAARSALLSACGLPTSHQLSHDDFIAIMAFDANFAPALGFNSSDTAPSFERVVLAFFRAVGSARFGAGSAVADRDGRPSARPLASPPPL